jgi:3-oxoadipate enol-lactonase
MPTIKANGIDINYVISGPENAPWITFSNSLGTNVTMWDEQAALLSKDWRVLRYDQRGHGGTEAPRPPYNFDQLIGDVVALWDALGVKKTAFCGLSMGGITGIGLCLKHPDRLIGFIGADCRCDSPPGFKEAWDERIAHALRHGMDSMSDLTVRRWFTKSFLEANPKVIEKVKGMIRTTPLDGWVGGCRALQEIYYREHLGSIRTPVQFLCGAEDGAANPAYMRPMHEAVPGSRFAVIPDTGHISNMEGAPQFNEIMTGFLKTL